MLSTYEISMLRQRTVRSEINTEKPSRKGSCN